MNIALSLILAYFSNTDFSGDEKGVPHLESVEEIIAVRGGGYFPVMIRMKNGSLGAAVRGGAPHLGLAGRLDWVHSEDGGKTWSKPAVIVDSKFDDRNPAVGQMPDGAIVVAYAEASTYNKDGGFDTSVGEFALYYVISTDNGKTWSEKKRLPHSHIKGGSPFGKIIVLPDGTALMSVYGGYDSDYKGPIRVPEGTKVIVGILRSTDNGRTWGDFSSISTTKHNETALLYLPDGKMIAMMRTEDDASLEQSESEDLGRTWSIPKRVTKGSQHPADVCLLKNGKLLLVYGNRLEPFGVGGMLSPDKGKTWQRDKRFMIGWKSLHSDCGYPSVVQLDDGTIVTMYYSVGTKDVPNEQMAIVARFKVE